MYPTVPAGEEAHAPLTRADELRRIETRTERVFARTIGPGRLVVDLAVAWVALTVTFIGHGYAMVAAAGLAVYAVMRLRGVRRRCAQDAEDALRDMERAPAPGSVEDVPERLLDVPDAQSIAQLDRIVRATWAPRHARISGVILTVVMMMEVLAISAAAVVIVLSVTSVVDLMADMGIWLCMLAAGLGVPYAAGVIYTAASSQTAAVFVRRAEEALAQGRLPVGDLDPAGAIRPTGDGTFELDRRRLPAHFRMRPSPTLTRAWAALPVFLAACAALLALTTL
ncbi:hypothetical protein [Microbacterium album]|uniref:Uncharacterized protein n=1 Tax=Microbacterium album TaxID=2053191 RepID=A0A917MNA8_9MICO|nr:hypothetical protein [Microbacterium album]GGH51217.1 hypothetical protein GCM10010921_30500 [Microbacterium album]